MRLLLEFEFGLEQILGLLPVVVPVSRRFLHILVQHPVLLVLPLQVLLIHGNLLHVLVFEVFGIGDGFD